MKLKTLFASLALLCIFTSCLAQDAFVGKPKSYVNGVLKIRKYKLLKSSLSNDGTPYDAYQWDKDGLIQAYFEYRDNICDMVTLVANRDLIASVLNSWEGYDKIDNMHWVSNDKLYKMWLTFSDNSDTAFISFASNKAE